MKRAKTNMIAYWIIMFVCIVIMVLSNVVNVKYKSIMSLTSTLILWSNILKMHYDADLPFRETAPMTIAAFGVILLRVGVLDGLNDMDRAFIITIGSSLTLIGLIFAIVIMRKSSAEMTRVIRITYEEAEELLRENEKMDIEKSNISINPEESTNDEVEDDNKRD